MGERQDESTGETVTYWQHFRNMNLKTINAEDNPISDTREVKYLRTLGCGGHMILRGTPCAAELLIAAAAASTSPSPEAQAEAEQADAAPAQQTESSSFEAVGWRLVLK